MGELFKVETNKGYELRHISSAYQKAVRRGDEAKALYWGYELYRSGYHFYAWKRLLIMVSEDIGLAESNLASQVKALFDIYEVFAKIAKKKDKGIEEEDQREQMPEPIHFIHALLLCVRAKKSRVCDNAKIYYDFLLDDNLPNKPPEYKVNMAIPDYALDKHTSSGRQLKRGGVHWLAVGAKLNNMANVEKEEIYFNAALRCMEFYDKYDKRELVKVKIPNAFYEEDENENTETK